MEITDEWRDMYENDDLEFQRFQEELLNSFKLQKIDPDNYIISFGSRRIVELKNCYYVSKGFIKQIFDTEIELFFEEDYEDIKEIDVNELLNQAIQEDWWDWRRQVAVYKGEVQEKI